MIDKSTISLTPSKDPKFIQVQDLSYMQDGICKTWEIAKTHDSVAILLIDKANNEFLFVKQFRPPVYLKNNDGYTYELCAGITDKDASIEQIAKEEILEECGYDIALSDLIRVRGFYSAVGFAGAKQTIFFAFVDESQKVSSGGGIEGESIEVIRCKIDEVFDFFTEEIATTPAVLYAVREYFARYANHQIIK